MVTATDSVKTRTQGRRTWILLRGLGRESAHWEDFLDRFKAAFPDDRVLTPDLPGSGRNREVACPVSISGITDWVRRECSVNGPVLVLAISLGGMIALDWAQRYPAEIAGVVLINASTGSLSKLVERLQPKVWGSFLRSMAERRKFEREKIVLSFISNLRAEDEALARRFAKIAEMRGVARSSVLRQLWAAIRFRPSNAKVKAPGLVLISANDRMVHPDCSRAIAKKWGLAQVEHSTAGHDLPLDDGPWVVEQVERWQQKLRNHA